MGACDEGETKEASRSLAGHEEEDIQLQKRE